MTLDPSHVKITACLIMRDEAANIPDCFSNMASLVDGYVVCDTGSLDRSVEIARESVPAGLYLDLMTAPWINYGHNRNVVLRRLERYLTPRMVAQTGIDLTSPITWAEYQRLETYRWYAFITDLDNRLHHCDPANKGGVPVELDRSHLTDESYFLESRRGGCTYRTNNLLRVDPLRVQKWHYYRSIHEYCDNREPWYRASTGNVEGCYIDYGCSGYRSRDIATSIRDIAMLLHDDKLWPDDSRVTFYLAQSYREAGCHDKAREYYQKRAEMKNTWHSERYLSYLYLADMVDRSKPEGDGQYLLWLYKGYEMGVQRFEIAYRICDYFRQKDLHRVGWLYAQPLMNVTTVDNSEFLIDDAITNYKFWDVTSLAAFYAGAKEESLLLTRRALAAVGLPPDYRQRLESNLSLIEGSLGTTPPVVARTVASKPIKSLTGRGRRAR